MKKLIATLMVLFLASCVGSLTKGQKEDLQTVKENHPEYYVQTKDPSLATGLGFVFGAGSFYTGHIGTGIAGLLLWPISITWDPFNGYEGALMVNYEDSKAKYMRAKKEGKKVPTLFNN